MILFQKIKNQFRGIRNYLTKRHILVSGGLFIVLSILFAYSPQTVHFSYAGYNCFKQLTFFPGVLKSSQNDKFEVKVAEMVKVANYPLIGTKVCTNPLSPPTEGTVKVTLSPWGLGIIGKSYKIETPATPVVSVTHLDKPLPAAKPVVLKLSTADRVFTYKLSTKDHQVDCLSDRQSLSCDIARLKLEQGQSHEVTVNRKFNDHIETLTRTTIDILPPVKVSDSSVKEGQTIYDKPSEIVLSFDKQIKTAKVTLAHLKDDSKTGHPFAQEISDNRLVIKFDSDLERQSDYQLAISEVEATDGSVLSETFKADFYISGGPQVSGLNVSKTGVDPNATIVLQLDQPIKADQDLSKLIELKGGSAKIKAEKDKVYVELMNIGRCTAFSINVAKGLISEYDVVSDQTWQFNSRTRCYTIETIGYSVQGRPINAYYFGNGDQTTLFTGAIHGNEVSSKYIMDSWIAELEANPDSIPASKQIVVVPTVSPDGVASSKRFNANNVNLNRNFPTRNWVSDTPVSGGRIEAGAGGSKALSEPESARLADFTRRLSPRMVVTYHSLGSLVNGNDVGIANALGPLYARIARYSYIPNAGTAETFGFEMTGTYEDWLAEIGTPAILIELNTNTGNHFAQNKAAMWEMVKG